MVLAGRHILSELGFSLTRSGDELHGRAHVVAEMCVPGTSSLRTSILAAWADHAAGLLAVDCLAPRVPVTLELDVQLHQQMCGHGTIQAVARVLKAGRTVVVASVDFTDDSGRPLAVGTAAFMAAPDPLLSLPPEVIDREQPAAPTGRLRVPLAERARCERREPGVAVLQRSDDGLNSSNTVYGRLVALVVEEAALSATLQPDPHPPPRDGVGLRPTLHRTLSSLAMRYLRPVRVGPAVATAEVLAGLGRVEVRDAGSDDRLAVVATTRTFDR